MPYLKNGGKFEVCPAMRMIDVFVDTFTQADTVKSSAGQGTVAVAIVPSVPWKCNALSSPPGPGTTDVSEEHVITNALAIP